MHENEAQQRAVLARSSSEAVARQRFVAEAMTWLGTPFRDQGDVKGPNGAVDCAMLIVRSAVDTGLVQLPPDDPRWPRPYPPQFHLHRDEERFLNIIRRFAAEVARDPVPGDVIVYRVARCFSHGAIVISPTHIVHAYWKTQAVSISPMHEVELRFEGAKPRPYKLFDLWKKEGPAIPDSGAMPDRAGAGCPARSRRQQAKNTGSPFAVCPALS
jgi:cell wall-associated NlpC family hydrolase